MKKILFLNSFYYPRYNVNGICVNEICKVLKENYDIYALAYKNYDEKSYYLDNGIKIYKVMPRLFFYFREYSERGKNKVLKKICNYIAICIQKFKRILFLPFYPFVSVMSVKRYMNKAIKICEKEKIDCIVATYYPLEALACVKKLKELYPKTPIILYVLDTLSNEKNNDTIINRYKRKKGKKCEIKYYQYADIIINMRCHEKEFNNKMYDQYRDKIFFSDIPLYRELDKPTISKIYDKNRNNIVYTGTLYKGRRDPTYVCELIKFINDNNMIKDKICAHFYSRGDCENILEKYSSNNNVVQHGFVKNEESINALYESDAIISIEAKNSDMISAKIFEYMSTGKKIIHFTSSKNDVLVKYYKKYDNVLFINENEDIINNAKKIVEFLNADVNMVYDFNKLKEAFIENTPKYTANIIKKVIEGEKIKC